MDLKATESNKNLHKQRDEILISEGLYQKVYSPDNIKSPEFPFTEWNSVTGSPRYFKKIALKVTDEEYTRIEESYNQNNPSDISYSNPIAKALQIIGILIYIVGLFSGIILGNMSNSFLYFNSYSENAFSLLLASVCWIFFFIFGTLFLGFSEIIKLLQGIKDK